MITNERPENEQQPKAKPRRSFYRTVQGIVHLFGGYTREDLREACRIAVDSYKADLRGEDAVDVRSWHYNKFGKAL